MKMILQAVIALVMVLGLSATAPAALILRGTDTLGNQLIYDTDLDITWYDYRSAPDSWDDQMAWAASLTVAFGDTIYDNWRLPTALNQDGSGPCAGHNCTGSEMGHLYYTELGNSDSFGDPLITSFIDGGTGLSESFMTLISDEYWFGTEYDPRPTYAWDFYTSDGFQGDVIKLLSHSAFAVLPGDVVTVPEAGTLLLLCTGLVGVALYRRRLGKR